MEDYKEIIDNEVGLNERDISVTGSRPLDINGLLVIFKVDLKAWTVKEFKINTWEIGRKDSKKDISITNGVIDGVIYDSGKISVEPLYQTKATLIRNEPLSIVPVLRPVELKIENKKPVRARRSQRSSRIKTALIITDTQIGYKRDIESGTLEPYHDTKAMDIALQLARKIIPDEIVVIGDFLDWTGWSDKFIVKPEFHFTTQPAINFGAKYLYLLREFTRKMVFIEGNHDVRPENQIIKHLAYAYNLKPADMNIPVMSIDNLLGLSRMGIEYIGNYPEASYWLGESLKILHGYLVRGKSGKTVEAILSSATESTVVGHIHRMEMVSKTVRTKSGANVVTAFCPGCLCHIDGRVPGSKSTDQWQQGFGVINYTDKSSQIIPVVIDKGETIFNNEVFSSGEELELFT